MIAHAEERGVAPGASPHASLPLDLSSPWKIKSVLLASRGHRGGQQTSVDTFIIKELPISVRFFIAVSPAAR